jgi:Na+-translocating ferredoxin:NAD+ oxidoreductase subunit G
VTVIREPSAPEMAVRTAAVLFVFVVLFTALLAGAYQWTRPSILASAAEEKMRLIGDVLPARLYDNALLTDTRSLGPTPELGLDDNSLVYRARKGGQPAALVLEAVAPDGYSGKIRLLIAISAEHAVLGVRVIGHKETPGLGDYIEPKKDQEARRSKTRPWIEQFNEQSFATLPEREWKVKKDGGRFSAHAGATVTPRAVVKAVAKALKYVEANHAPLFSQEAGKS